MAERSLFSVVDGLCPVSALAGDIARTDRETRN
jgi:hypothetical protein